MLDGLRFDADTGVSGEKSGQNGADGKYVEPKAHIIVTTQTMFARWLHEHKEWWDKGIKNVPQQIGAALKSESFYTQAISTGAAVINFNSLPIALPASSTSGYAMLAGRTQSEIPDDADEVFVSALADGKVYVAYGSIVPKVQIPACMAIRAGYDKRAEQAYEKFQRRELSKKAYDKLGNLRQQGEDAFKRCFTRLAPAQPAFAEATKQAQALLAAAWEITQGDAIPVKPANAVSYSAPAPLPLRHRRAGLPHKSAAASRSRRDRQCGPGADCRCWDG